MNPEFCFDHLLLDELKFVYLIIVIICNIDDKVRDTSFNQDLISLV